MPASQQHSSADLEPRKGSPSPRLSENEFKRRFLNQFQDPAYESLSVELSKIAAAAWEGYANSRKSPKTRKAGPGFAEPEYELSVALRPNTVGRFIPAKHASQRQPHSAIRRVHVIRTIRWDRPTIG